MQLSPLLIEHLFSIIYELGTWSQDSNSYFTLKDYLCGGVKLAKNADSDK